MNLTGFFKENPKIALGFSGGVDSSYLLYAAAQCGVDIKPYFIKTAFQPEFELEDARRFAKQDRKSTRLNSSHGKLSRMPSSA